MCPSGRNNQTMENVHRVKSVLILYFSFFIFHSAFAVKTERWELKTPADFTRGKLHGLSLSSDGELRLGYGTTRLGEFAKEIWCSTVAGDGTIYFGTGSPADVYAVGKDGRANKIFE